MYLKLLKVIEFLKLKKIFLFIFALIILFLLAFFIRLKSFSYPINENPEIFRDYLIARHIVLYQEFPLVGPPAHDTFINNPIFYYVTALFLLFSDSAVFLNFLSIFFQLLSMWVIFLIGKKMFQPAVGFLATILFAFSWTIFSQSGHYWQPYIMTPIIYGSYYLLLLFSEKNEFKFAKWTVVLFLLAISINLSALVLSPIYFLLLFCALKKHKRKVKDYLKICFFVLVLVVVLWSPVFVFMFKNHSIFLPTATSKEIISFDFFQLLYKFLESLKMLKEIFFINFSFRSFNLGNIFLIIVSFLGIVYGYFQKNNLRVKYVFILLGAIFFPVVISSISTGKISNYHFLPVYGLILILISEVIFSSLFNRPWAIPFGMVVIILLIKVVSFNFKVFEKQSNFTLEKKIKHEMFKSIENQLQEIQPEYLKSNFDFFEFRTYENRGADSVSASAFFWSELEKKHKRKFVSKDIWSYKNFTVINRDTSNHFIVCIYVSKENCLYNYILENSDFKIEKQLFEAQNYLVFFSSRITKPK